MAQLRLSTAELSEDLLEPKCISGGTSWHARVYTIVYTWIIRMIDMDVSICMDARMCMCNCVYVTLLSLCLSHTISPSLSKS